MSYEKNLHTLTIQASSKEEIDALYKEITKEKIVVATQTHIHIPSVEGQKSFYTYVCFIKP